MATHPHAALTRRSAQEAQPERGPGVSVSAHAADCPKHPWLCSGQFRRHKLRLQQRHTVNAISDDITESQHKGMSGQSDERQLRSLGEVRRKVWGVPSSSFAGQRCPPNPWIFKDEVKSKI